MSNTEFCRQTVQQHAPHLYLISLMAPNAQTRSVLWCVFAFYHEVSKTRSVVSEPTLGLIRLQWWRDELHKIYQGQGHSNNDILTSVSDIIAAQSIDIEIWLKMIDAHDDELRQESAPSSVNEAITMIKGLNTPLVQAVNDILDLNETSDVVESVALNRGLVDVLRRAQPDSIIRKAHDSFTALFQPKLQPKSRVMKALHNQACLQFSHMKAHQFDPYQPRFHHLPACEALRLWTSLCFS